jgi:hypothetical protein
MADSTPDLPKHRAKRSRFVPLAWVSGVAAAAVLTLGVTGTLSSWTAAVLDNSTNSTKIAQSLILQETQAGVTPIDAACVSSANANNMSTCASINKFGGTGTPLVPGASSTPVTVTFTNVGTGTGTAFGIYPGVTPASATVPGTTTHCTQSPAPGVAISTSTAAVYNDVCGSTAVTTNLADVQLTLACFTGTTAPATGTAGQINALSYSGNLAGFNTALTSPTALAPNNAVTCKFSVTLSTTASPLDGGLTLTQPIRWVLT